MTRIDENSVMRQKKEYRYTAETRRSRKIPSRKINNYQNPKQPTITTEQEIVRKRLYRLLLLLERKSMMKTKRGNRGTWIVRALIRSNRYRAKYTVNRKLDDQYRYR